MRIDTVNPLSIESLAPKLYFLASKSPASTPVLAHILHHSRGTGPITTALNRARLGARTN